jgi:hypothetical protein
MQPVAYIRWIGLLAVLVVVGGVIRIATHNSSSSTATQTPPPTPLASSPAGPGGSSTPPATPSASGSPTQSPHHHHVTSTTPPTTSATAATTAPSGGTTSAPPSTRPTPTSSSSSGSGSQIVTPAFGSYRYKTSGSEKTNFGGARSFPSQTTIKLAAKGSCVTSTWQPVRDHKEVETLCPQGKTALRLKTIQQTIKFFGFGPTQTLNCDKRAIIYSTSIKPGDTWQFTCSSMQGTGRERALAVGFQRFTIGGVSVRALHVHVVATIAGKGESGTSTEDYWYAPKLGMLVKNTGRVNAKDDVGGTTAVYSENYSLLLDSTKPTS